MSKTDDNAKPRTPDGPQLENHLSPSPGQPVAGIPGYDPKFNDIVDYIIRITHEIWEEKAVGTLYDYYANTIQIHTTGETIYGREAVIAGTLATLAAFPDRRLYGDEVIWCGDAETGFYTSHRITHAGTNRGWTAYGPPTGEQVRYRAIADCFSRENIIREEWLIRDELTLVSQLGLDPVATAKKMAQQDVIRGLPGVVGDVQRGVGQHPPDPVPPAPDGGFSPEYFIQAMLHEVWNWRMINKVRDYFAPGAYAESASQRKLHGPDAYQAYVLGLLAPFPDLSLTVEHFCSLPAKGGAHRTATRWRLRGTHTGYGVYGEPTGNPINVLGVSHHLIQNGRIVKEWTLFDEFALLKQIHAPKS